jgi:DinB superfamily
MCMDEKNGGEMVVLAAQHGLQVRSLIGAPHSSEASPMACKELMLAALSAAEIDLLTTFRLVKADDVAVLPVCGIWTLTQLAGHLADWDALFLQWLKLLCGEQPNAMEWDEAWDDDGDALNAHMQVKREGQAWQDARHDLRKCRIELYQAFSAVSPNDFMRVQPARVGVSYPTIYHCAWSALEHYLDHAAGVRRSLNLPLSSELLNFHGPYT